MGSELYLHARLGSVAVGCYAFLGSLVAIAVVHIFIPFEVAETNTEELMIHIKKHFQQDQNGTYYYDWVDPETGEEKHKILNQRWFFEVKAGRLVYKFGGNYENFCTNRTVPEDQWLPSLFKSTQLKAMVQVPLRMAILLAMGIRLALLLFTLNHKKKGVFGDLLIVLEAAHQVSLFEYFNYLYTPDENYAYVLPRAILTMHLTLVLKLIGSCVLIERIPEIMFRIFLAMVCTVTYLTVNGVATQFIEQQYCDEYVTAPEAIIEYTFLAVIVISAALDLRMAKNFEIFVGPEEEQKESKPYC